MSTSNKLVKFNHSTGLKEVDYILADKNTVKDEEKFYGPKSTKSLIFLTHIVVLNINDISMNCLIKKWVF